LFILTTYTLGLSEAYSRTTIVCLLLQTTKTILFSETCKPRKSSGWIYALVAFKIHNLIIYIQTYFSSLLPSNATYWNYFGIFLSHHLDS